MANTFKREPKIPGWINVPTWCSDGDGMVVIEKHTNSNRKHDSRFDDGIKDKRGQFVGYAVFDQFELLGKFANLKDAKKYAMQYFKDNYQQ